MFVILKCVTSAPSAAFREMTRPLVVCVSSVVVAFVTLGVALGDEFTAIISKVEDGKVTFKKFKGFNKEEKKADLGDEQTLPTTGSVKVVKAKFDKETKKSSAGEDIEGGLKNEMFTKIDPKKGKGFFGGGLMATIVTDADNKNITEIRVFQFGNFKKKKDADKQDK